MMVYLKIIIHRLGRSQTFLLHPKLKKSLHTHSTSSTIVDFIKRVTTQSSSSTLGRPARFLFNSPFFCWRELRRTKGRLIGNRLFCGTFAHQKMSKELKGSPVASAWKWLRENYFTTWYTIVFPSSYTHTSTNKCNSQGIVGFACDVDFRQRN